MRRYRVVEKSDRLFYLQHAGFLTGWIESTWGPFHGEAQAIAVAKRVQAMANGEGRRRANIIRKVWP